MKVFVTLAVLIFAIALSSGVTSLTLDVSAQDAKKPQNTYTLSTEAKLGQVAFSHLDHTTKNRNVEGTGQSACIECQFTVPSELLINDPFACSGKMTCAKPVTTCLSVPSTSAIIRSINVSPGFEVIRTLI